MARNLILLFFFFYYSGAVAQQSKADDRNILVSAGLLLPLTHISPIDGNKPVELAAPRKVLYPTIMGEITYKKGKHIISLLAKQGVVGTSFAISNTLYPYFNKAYDATGITQLQLSLNYGQTFARQSKFLFGTKLQPFWQAGIGVGFNRSKAYYAEQYKNHSWGWINNEEFTVYNYDISKGGLGLFITPRLGIKLLSKNKQKEILNLNAFYDYGLARQATFNLQYEVGLYNANGEVSNSKKGNAILYTKGTNFGLSISTPLKSFKIK